jgi:hypothetical protein
MATIKSVCEKATKDIAKIQKKAQEARLAANADAAQLEKTAAKIRNTAAEHSAVIAQAENVINNFKRLFEVQ